MDGVDKSGFIATLCARYHAKELMDTTNYRTMLDQGLVYLFAWLTGHVAYFGDNARFLPDTEAWLDHLGRNGADPTTANQHYTLVQVVKDGTLVGTGFFQCSGRNVGMNLFGVKNSEQRAGIGSKLLAWYLSGLPTTAATGNITLGTLHSNDQMRAWCARFGGTETGRDNDVIIRFDIAAACRVFGIPLPGHEDYRFSNRFGDLEFHVVYAGPHPAFVDSAHPPIAQEVLSVM